MSEGSARTEMERRLVEKSLEDDAFRQRLVEEPKGVVEQELGTRLPEEVRVVVVEEGGSRGDRRYHLPGDSWYPDGGPR